MDIEKEIYDYMNYLMIERQLSNNTIDAYKRDLYSFFNYVKRSSKSVNKDDIIKLFPLNKFLLFGLCLQ